LYDQVRDFQLLASIQHKQGTSILDSALDFDTETMASIRQDFLDILKAMGSA